MRLSDTLSTAYRGVTANIPRAALTMLGIIIGVGSVVMMTAIGASMEQVILGQISSLGARSMVIFPGGGEGGPNGIGTGQDSLTLDDVEALEQLSTIETVAPVIFIKDKVTYGREEASPQVFGVRVNFFKNQKITAAEGRLLDEADISGAKRVAVMAPDAAEKLFGNSDPLGKRVQIGDGTYTVIGMTKALGSQFFQNADNRIYVPFTVAQEVTGQRYVNYITLQSRGNTDLAFADIKSLLRQRHDIDNPEDDEKEDDFGVRSSAQANEILSGVSLGLTAFITTVAAISLIVGGIGIMNVMIVTVTERTREIGLRKALGARERDVLLQFLTEAVLLTMIGSAIGAVGGIALAAVASLIVNRFLSTYHFAVSLPAVAVAFLMAALTGVVFGLSPARKAAKLHPIESLRYE